CVRAKTKEIRPLCDHIGRLARPQCDRAGTPRPGCIKCACGSGRGAVWKKCRPEPPRPEADGVEIGRASCREREKVTGEGIAGDGIRDPLVTGVQTCALPI